jgi:hypothetical protein
MRRSILTAAAAAVVVACSAASPAFADEIDGATEPVIVEETETVEETDTVEEPDTEEPAVDPIPVTPIGVEYFDDCGTMNDGFFLPEEQEGVVDYLFETDGWGTPITVTAVLDDGYVLADGAVDEWEYPASTDEPCEDGTEQPAPPQGEVPVKLEPAAATDETAPELAATGVDGGSAALIGGAALLLGGALLGAQALRRRAAAKQ